MSKLVKSLAAVMLIISIVAFAPGNAEARWGGGWHGGGWHGGGWRGGGWRGGWGGGWGPAFGWGWGPGFGWGVGNPYVYGYGPPRCGWVPVRVWRNGHRVLRSVWRCW